MYNLADKQQIVSLIADFRVILATFKSINQKPNLSTAEEELTDYLNNHFPIFVATDESEKDKSDKKNYTKIVGYIVCRIVDRVIWAESLYVTPDHRNRGIGGRLYHEAEVLAHQLGCETVYNWIHPNNTNIIGFLKKRGYSVLNLIEIRKPLEHELLTQRIKILDKEFDY